MVKVKMNEKVLNLQVVYNKAKNVKFIRTKRFGQENNQYKQKQWKPIVNYFETMQTNISQKMRAITVSWLFEVAEFSNRTSDVVHLAVDIMDKTLCQLYIHRKELQLVAIVSLLIASKYFEVLPIEADECVEVSANCYTTTQLLELEKKILFMLDFKVFSERNNSFHIPETKVGQLTRFFFDVQLLNFSMTKYHRNTILTSCQLVAELYIADYEWQQRVKCLIENNFEELENLKICTSEIIRHHLSESKSELKPICFGFHNCIYKSTDFTKQLDIESLFRLHKSE